MTKVPGPPETEQAPGDAAIRLRAIGGWQWPLLLVVMLSGPPLMALTFAAIAPVLPAIASHFNTTGGGVIFAQWVMTAPAVGLMLGGPIGGLLIDRIGPRYLIIGTFLLFALAGSAGLYVNSAPLLLFSRFLLGLAGSGTAAAATWLVGERFDEEKRRRMLGIQDSIAGVAAMSAVLLSGTIGASGGWRMSFAIYLVAAPLLLFAFLAVPRVKPEARRTQSSAVSSIFIPLWPIYLIIFGMGGLMMLPSTQVPFLLAESGIKSPVIHSRVIASSAALAIVFAAFYGPIRQKLGEQGTFLAIIFAYAAGTILLSQSTDALRAAFGCMLLGVGTGMLPPHFASVIIGRTDPLVRGRAIGLMYGSIFLSEFVSPLVILPLRKAFGVHGSFLALGCALCIGFALALLYSNLQRRVKTSGS